MALYRLKKRIKTLVKAVALPHRTARNLRTLYIQRGTNRQRLKSYQKWFDQQKMSPVDIEEQRQAAEFLSHKPTISILMPVYDTPEKYLRQCIESVIGQTYRYWQLCVVDDASPSDVISIVKEYADKDSRIKWHRSSENEHIAGASNRALKSATGAFVGLLDHDDLLMPNALFEVAKVINKHHSADLIYSDEDKVDQKGNHLEPFFKPDWSPDFLLSCNYITHFSVFRRELLEKIGGFRVGTEGAQDWDLILRATAETKKIYHVPKIIYSWRKLPTSTAINTDSKPYAYINQRKVLRDFIKRVKRGASVLEHVYLGFWRVRYPIQDNPLVSIIIPSKDNYFFIQQCVRSIVERSTYSNFEIIIVDTGTSDEKALEFYSSKLVTTNDIKIVKWHGRFNFSAVCNHGVKEAKGTYLLFLNDDTKVITASWIEGLLEHAQRENVGMVGGKLLFPNWRIQHAGVVLSQRDIAFHPFYDRHHIHDIFINIFVSNIRNCAALTGACFMTSRKKFEAVGGFDEALSVTYGDVDLCLKFLEKGYFNVYTPFVQLFHYESVSVGKIMGSDRDQEEVAKAAKHMRQRWAKYLARDPFYNDNFMQHGPGYDF